MSCDNIYIWGNQRKEFTNASNITLHRANIAYPFTELKGRTIRVIVHDASCIYILKYYQFKWNNYFVDAALYKLQQLHRGFGWISW